jgi:hypothetical protein
MDLPKNARVAVVDNAPDEVADLLSVLAKEGVSTLFYNGPSAFPATPLTGIRLLFLDLELAGLENANEKTKASAAAANLKRLIGPDNGPLLVVLWTNHAEVAELSKQYMLQAVKLPLFVVPIDKADCMEGKSFVAEKIKSRIAEMLTQSSADCVGLYVDWENAVFDSTVKLSARLSSVADGNGDKWSEIMSRAFYKLYRAECGKNALQTAQEQFVSSCHLYNSGLISNLDAAIAEMHLGVSSKFRLKDSSLKTAEEEESLTSKLNAFLFYDSMTHAVALPGDVFAVRDVSDGNLLKAVLYDFGAKNDELDELSRSEDVRLCKVIITPPCDAANNKRLRVPSKDNDNSKCVQYERYAWALLVSGNARSHLTTKRGEYAYDFLRRFEFAGKVCDLLVDLYAIGTEVIDANSMDRIFTLKPIPLADIQYKAANQLNRIGICAVE